MLKSTTNMAKKEQVLLLGDLRAIMVKHPSASVKPVTNQGRIIREYVLGLILLLVV